MSYLCFHCGRPWTSSRSRQVHELRAHPGLTVPDAERVERQHESEVRWRRENPQAARDKTRRWRRTPRGREFARLTRQQQIRDGKHSARMAVQRAIERGAITRQPCRECGAVPAEAHHYLGYEREHWLDIEWLCDLHHVRAHHVTKGPAGSVVELVT